MNKFLTTLIVTLAGTSLLQAAKLTSDWTSSGGGVWEDESNWSSALYPDRRPGDTYFAVIDDSAENRTITTSGALILDGLTLDQASAAGSLTLKLGGNMELVGRDTVQKVSITNTAGDASKLVIDLNGHHLNISATVSTSSVNVQGNYTVKSTGGGGTISQRQIYSGESVGAVHYDDGVTLRLTQSAAQRLRGRSFSEGSTLQMAAAGSYSLLSDSVSLGNLIIGDHANTAATNIDLRGIRVIGNFSILSYEGAENGAASTLTFSNNQKLYVSGNFLDEGSDNTSYINTNGSGKGTIVFNGGQLTEREVSIGRQSLETHFQVGESAESQGNVVLKNNLSTSESFLIRSESRVNLVGYRIHAKDVTLEADAIIALALGSETGLIHATGDLALNDFSLELSLDGDWVNGSDLVLFRYEGELSGTPALVNLPTGFTFEELVNDTENKQIYLSHVVAIPEPGSTALLILAGAIAAAKIRAGRKL